MKIRQVLSLCLFAVAACAVATGDHGAGQEETVAQESSALTEAVTATVTVGNKNSKGYPVTVRVTNTGPAVTTSWTVVLNKNSTAAISATSGGTFAQSGTTLTVTPGTAAIAANGGSTTFAFTEAARPTLVSATGTAACNAATCATGCCTTSGACTTTETVAACGVGGKACVACTAPTNGTVACSAGNCADTCPTGESLCSGSACKNLQTDNNNCGGCGNVCASGATCTAGKCVTPCNATTCAKGCCTTGGTCSTAETTAACGLGGTACVACTAPTNGTVACSAGSCADTCSTGESLCSGNACKNLQTDNNNCGGCGNVCTGGATCTAGRCVWTCNPTTCPNGCCPEPGESEGCVTTETITACGTGGNVCRNCPATGPDNAITTCSAGQCEYSAPPGDSLCGYAYVNLQTDNNNCGTCGNVCASGAKCTAGTCVATCNPTTCANGCCTASGTCSTAETPTACGTGGYACSDCYSQGPVQNAIITCTGGACTYTNPSPNDSLCPNGYFDLNTDPNNCGSCGNVCPGTYAACWSGGCWPQTLFTDTMGTPANIAVNSSTGIYYFTDSSLGTVTMLLNGTPATLATGQSAPTQIGVNATNVFWLNSATGDVWTYADSNGWTGAVGNSADAIAVDPNGVYYTISAPATNGAAVEEFWWNGYVQTNSVWYAGGAPWLAPMGIAVDTQNVYWTAGPGAAPGSSAGVWMVPLMNQASSPAQIAFNQTSPTAIAASSGYVFWINSNGTSGTIMGAIPATGEVVPIATGQANPYSIAADATGVYWINLGTNPPYGAGTVMKASLANGLAGATPVVIASTMSGAPVGITLSSGFVYWADDNLGSGAGGAIRYFPETAR